MYHGIFYRLVVDAEDHSKDETEIALNAAEVRSIRYLVANMAKHMEPDMQEFPFHGIPTIKPRKICL